MSLVKNILFITIFFVLISKFADAHTHVNPTFQNDWKMIASVKSENFQKTLKEMSELDLDIAGVDTKNQIVDVLISDIDYKLLIKNGYKVTINEIKGVSAAPDVEYKNPEEIELLVKEFADRYPTITKRMSIGKSLEGRDIWAIKISDNPEINELDEPTLLFNSMHHAREIMTPEVSLDIIETLLNGYSSDPKITTWVNENQIWVIPMFNVDGNNKMWSSDKWWRKNTRGGYGVDLNRNYPAGWNKCNGSSGWRSSQTYRGPSPASEPETQAMMNFIKETRPVFDISYHSYSELVIYPLGCNPERTINKDVIEKIGKEIGKKLNYAAGTAWELLYNADGGDIDWMYEAYQVIPYVIELNSRKEGFHPDYATWRDKTVKRNQAGWMHLLERVSQSGIRGSVTVNGEKITDYKIEVETNNQLVNNYLSHHTGMFHLVLNPGSYNLKFKVDKKVIGTKKIDVKDQLRRVVIEL